MKVYIIALFLLPSVVAFSSMGFSRRTYRTWLASSSSSPPEIGTMRLRDIQNELKTMGVPYSDCFDKESLTIRLREAREGKFGTKPESSSTETTQARTTPTASTPPIDLESASKILQDLRSKSIKELKIECSSRSLRYATFLEKEDFVQAIWNDMKNVASFSVSGVLRPGFVADITGTQLDEELTSDTTPLLLDIYATWCGPCKMMAPELEKAASELGSRCRVAKLDSDKHPQWAARYKVEGLPTILLLHKGQIQARVEGACMKDKLVDLAKPHL